MPARVFIDSNVIIYATADLANSKVAKVSLWLREATDRESACLNLQVLNEVTNVMLKKRRDFEADAVFQRVDHLRALGETPVTAAIVHEARKVRLQTGYSWWDCILLASALELDCTHFLSEDLQDGHRVTASDGKGLTIVDPFAHSPARFLSEQD